MSSLSSEATAVAVVNLPAFRALASQLTQSRFPGTRTTVKKVSNDQPNKLLAARRSLTLTLADEECLSHSTIPSLRQT